MENLKREALEICNMYYEGARDLWISQIDKARNGLGKLEVNQDEIDRIAD